MKTQPKQASLLAYRQMVQLLLTNASGNDISIGSVPKHCASRWLLMANLYDQ
jgi:hypothetical protein